MSISHEANPSNIVTTGQWHPEEDQDLIHEQIWPQLAARPYIWVKSLWAMFDFASDLRNEGGTPGINDKGMVTYDRTIKKDAFYYYKAQWSKLALSFSITKAGDGRSAPMRRRISRFIPTARR